jgi:hypothetical protein
MVANYSGEKRRFDSYATEAGAMDTTRRKGQPQQLLALTGNKMRFASHRLAQTQNAAQAALKYGNCPEIIFAHYRELVKPADVLKWFSVAPVASQNVR